MKNGGILIFTSLISNEAEHFIHYFIAFSVNNSHNFPYCLRSRFLIYVDQLIKNINSLLYL